MILFTQIEQPRHSNTEEYHSLHNTRNQNSVVSILRNYMLEDQKL